MSTTNKAISNRANARASTGPKSGIGKARVAKNALRHGLSLPVFSDPALSSEVRALMSRIAGKQATPEIKQFAARIAEADVDLMRVRRARYDLLSWAFRNGDLRSYAAMELARGEDAPVPPKNAHLPNPAPKLEGSAKLATIMTDLASQLAALDRYERRAFSRRKFAIRDFDEACRANQS